MNPCIKCGDEHGNTEQDHRQACSNRPASCRRLPLSNFPPSCAIENSQYQGHRKHESGEYRKNNRKEERDLRGVGWRQKSVLMDAEQKAPNREYGYHSEHKRKKSKAIAQEL